MTDPLSLRAMAELEERVARAVAVARELNPETLHQNYGPDEPADATLSNGKAAHYGWRHHVAVAKAAIAVCQSSWANEKAEMERQLAAYRDPDWTKNPRTARSDKNMEDGWALGEAKEAAEAALAEADRLGADYMSRMFCVQAEMIARLTREKAEMVSALKDCADAMYADNPADGWKEIIERARVMIARHRLPPAGGSGGIER